MYVILQTDNFQNALNKAAAAARGQSFDGNGQGNPNSNIRRPYRGIQIKKDTYAVLSVRQAVTNIPIPLISSSALGVKGGIGTVNNYADFIVQHIEDQRMEKQQIIETFGDVYIYFFGERPRIVTIGGLLMNTQDFNWRAQFWANYDQYLRGTKLVELNARCFFAYDSIVLEGYVLNAQATDINEDPYSIPFQMSMVLTDYHDYSNIGDVRFPGDGSMNADALNVANSALSELNNDFVSTGAQVRNLNMTAGGAGGFLANLRSGIQNVNNMLNNGGLLQSVAGGTIASVADAVAGRAMVLPTGAGAFVANLGSAYLGAGSVLTSDQVQFDAKTGKMTTVGGVPVSNKLLMASTGAFAPTWVSSDTGTTRGDIWENYDEYPLAPSKSLQQLIGPIAYAAMQLRAAKTILTATDAAYTASLINAAAGPNPILGAIAGIAGAVSAGFGLFVNGAAALSSVTSLTQALTGATPSQLLSAATLGLVQINPTTGQPYLGFAAGQTLSTVAANAISGVKSLFSTNPLIAANPGTTAGAATLGSVYQSGVYAGATSTNPSTSGGSAASALSSPISVSSNAGATQTNPATASDVTYSAPVSAPVSGSVSPTSGSAGSQTGAAAVSGATVPEVYNSNTYRSNTTAAASLNYEEAYSDSDYTSLMDQQKVSDAAAAASNAAIAAGLQTGNANALQAALSATYGDTDIQQRLDISAGTSPSDLVTLYGPSQWTLSQLQLILAASGSDVDPATIFTPELIQAVRNSVANEVKNQTYGAEVTPESLEAVYGIVSTLPQQKLTDSQRAQLLQLIYGSALTNPQSDTDTSGITGAGADAAPINPVA